MLGLVSAPAIGERYEAVRDGGARLNGEPIHVSRADRISRSFILYSGLEDWLTGPHWAPFRQLVSEARRSRGFGDFWGHMLVARGAADAMMEAELATWDWAAAQVVVEEAGGRMTTFDGSPLSDTCSVLTTNGALHDELIARLRG